MLAEPGCHLAYPERGRIRPCPCAEKDRPPGDRPTMADVADVRQLDLSPRHLRTRFGGLFLFLPILTMLPLDRIFRQAGLPGSRMIPADRAMLSLLALKLFGTARPTHVMSAVLARGWPCSVA